MSPSKNYAQLRNRRKLINRNTYLGCQNWNKYISGFVLFLWSPFNFWSNLPEPDGQSILEHSTYARIVTFDISIHHGIGKFIFLKIFLIVHINSRPSNLLTKCYNIEVWVIIKKVPKSCSGFDKSCARLRLLVLDASLFTCAHLLVFSFYY